MTELFLSTAQAFREEPAATPPMPTSSGSLYLIGLLAKQEGLEVARNALIARSAFADTEETRYLSIQLGIIQSDYVKLDALITAYLSSSTIIQPISQNGLRQIRDIVEQLQGVVAQRQRAQDVIALVTRLLNEWDGEMNE